MKPACFAVAPLPAAWLQGDVLAEYTQFQEEAAPSPQPMHVPVVASLQGDVLAEHLRFQQEAATPPAPPMHVPVEGLKGEVLESEGAAAVDPERQEAQGSDDVDGYDDGLAVDDDHEGFMDDGGGGFTDDGDVDCDDSVMEDEGQDVISMQEDEEEEVEAELELLLPHILDLPAFRARAAAPPVQKEPAPGFPHQGGWLQLVSCSDEATRLREEEIKKGVVLSGQQLSSDSSFICESDPGCVLSDL